MAVTTTAVAEPQSYGQYLTEPKQLSPLSKPLAPLGEGEVLISPRSVTLCGSDMHYYQKGCNGSIHIREPLCLGHEFAGEVVDVGPGVSDRQVGDLVAVEPGVACGQCKLCADGRYNLCTKLRFRGSGSAWPHYQGGLQSRVVHPSAWTHRLPSDLTAEDGALLEPLAVAVHSCRRAAIKVGSTCTIIGAGAVGLLCAVAARVEGCAQVVIADIVPARVEFATKHGFADAGFVVPAKRAEDALERLNLAKGVAAAISALRTGDGSLVGQSDYTFECTGVESCVQASIYTTKSGGKTVLVGMGTPNHLLPISEASAREVDIIPVWRYANCYARAIEVMQLSHSERSVPDLRQMLTHRFRGLDSVPAALECACRSQDDSGNMVIKVVVNIDDETH